MQTAAPPKTKQKTSLLVSSLTPLVVISGVCLLASGSVFMLEGAIATVWPAFLLVMLGPLVFPFILFPAGLMAGLWNALHGSKRAVVRVFAVASVTYLAFVMAATLGFLAMLATGLPGAGGASSLRFFAEMFVVSGAVTPWAVFALRDRSNQLFILLVWAQALAGTLALPLKMAGIVGPVGYGGAAWAGILLVMLAEYVRGEMRGRVQKQAATPQQPPQGTPPQG